MSEVIRIDYAYWAEMVAVDAVVYYGPILSVSFWEEDVKRYTNDLPEDLFRVDAVGPYRAEQRSNSLESLIVVA